MPMKPLAGLFLALACLLGIASTGSVFELAYGDPDLGLQATRWILCLSLPARLRPCWWPSGSTSRPSPSRMPCIRLSQCCLPIP